MYRRAWVTPRSACWRCSRVESLDSNTQSRWEQALRYWLYAVVCGALRVDKVHSCFNSYRNLMGQLGGDGSDHLTQGSQRERPGFFNRPTEGFCDSFVHTSITREGGWNSTSFFHRGPDGCQDLSALKIEGLQLFLDPPDLLLDVLPHGVQGFFDD